MAALSDKYYSGNKSDPAEWVVYFQWLQQVCTHEGVHMFSALMVHVDFFLILCMGNANLIRTILSPAVIFYLNKLYLIHLSFL